MDCVVPTVESDEVLQVVVNRRDDINLAGYLGAIATLFHA